MDRVEAVDFFAFDWDPQKRERTLKERGIDFLDVTRSLQEPDLQMPSEREGEARVLALIQIEGRVLAAIFTIREGVCRIISARPARRDERRAHREIFGE